MRSVAPFAPLPSIAVTACEGDGVLWVPLNLQGAILLSISSTANNGIVAADVRVPFVIAETGMSGREETHPRALSVMKAQAAVAKYDEFQGNVAFVGTLDFYPPKEQSPSGQGYHWNSNAET